MDFATAHASEWGAHWCEPLKTWKPYTSVLCSRCMGRTVAEMQAVAKDREAQAPGSDSTVNDGEPQSNQRVGLTEGA